MPGTNILRKLLLVTCLSTSLSALAADYPTHAIKFIVPYNAGGGTDVLARAVAQGTSEMLDQSIVVDNRPGASGMIGADMVAEAAPDGYTLIATASDTHTINPHVYPNIPYNAQKDFTPVARVGYLPYAMVVNPQLGVKNIQDYIALAKNDPGKLTYASWGVGSSSHVAMEMLNVNQQLDVLHVPYTGAAPAMTALIGGQVDALFVPLSLAKPNADAGKVQIMGLAAPKRFVDAPEVPTMVEQGINVIASPWIGILAPAGTPAAHIDVLSNAVIKATGIPAVAEALTKGGLEIAPQDAKDFGTYLTQDYKAWGDTVQAAHIKAE